MMKLPNRKRIGFGLTFLVFGIFLLFTGSVEKIEWQKGNNMVYKRGEHASAVIDGEIYVLGGIYNPRYGPPYIEKYDIAADEWTSLGVWRQPRHHFTIGDAVYNHEIWVCGGKWGDQNSGTNRVDVYNVETNTWRQGPDLPEIHWGGPAVIVDNKLHVFTGAFDNYTTTDHHFVLDLENESAGWRSATPVPKPRVHVAGVALNSKIYLVGGEYHHSHDGDTKTVQVYDPETGSWDLSKAQLPIPRSHLEWSTFAYQGKIISVSGVNSDDGPNRGQSDILVYDPEQDAWKTLGHLPYDMTSPGAKAYNGKLYVYGGGKDDWFPVHGNTYFRELDLK